MASRHSRTFIFLVWIIVAILFCNNHPNIASAAASKSSNNFMFIAYGDTRSDPVTHRQIVAMIVGMKPEFVLQSGDLVDHGDNKAEWDEFDQITTPFLTAHIPYYPARGNHDIGSYYIKEVTEKYDSGNGYYYSFQRHGIKFIALDNFEPYTEDSDQYKWLIGQLDESKKTHQTVIPFCHESPFSVGPHGDNFDIQKILHPVFAKYKVPLVFVGHDHLYYRTVRDGVTYIVTGGGGAPLYEATNLQYSIPGDVYKSVHHVVKCDVTQKAITLTAIELDGTVIDTLTVKR